MERPLNLYEVLGEEAERLNDIQYEPVAFDGMSAEEEAAQVRKVLPKLFGKIHTSPRPRTALCLSGGGIRSATFGLGIIQRLARLGLLSQFDFLSTVSGGGYIGSWLSSYARRNLKGMSGVADELKDRPATPLDPEPKPVKHLREYSNYLTPRLGLFSGDTWALVGSYLRNLFLNWLVLIPLLAAFLGVPRFVVAVLHNTSGRWIGEFEVGTMVLLGVSMLYLAFTRPPGHRPKTGFLYTNGGFLSFVAVPFALAAIGIFLTWGWTSDSPPNWLSFFIALVVVSMFGSVVYMLRYRLASPRERREDVRGGVKLSVYTWKKFVQETLSAAISGAVAAGLLYALAHIFNDPRRPVVLPQLGNWKSLPALLDAGSSGLYVCFAVPAVMAVLFLQAALFVGLSSWYNEDYDREWWARAGGWILVIGLAWIVFAGITIYGPVLLYFSPRLFAAIGLSTAGIVAIVGKGGATGASANDKEADKKSIAANILLALAGPLFVLCFLSAISLVTSRILLKVENVSLLDEKLISFYAHGSYRVRSNEQVPPKSQPELESLAAPVRVFETSPYPAMERDKLRALEHLYAVDRSQRDHVAYIIAGALFGWLLSGFIGVNKFSMHALYRNRIIRAYLGASRWTRRPNLFSGFDPNDNVLMHRLRTEALWVHSFRDLDGFVAALRGGETKLLAYLLKNLSPRTRKVLASYRPSGDNDFICELLMEDLNRIIDEHDLKAKKPWPYNPRQSLANREILDADLKDFIEPPPGKRPLHIVNIALNLVSGKNLAWQQRKASSFTVSALHSGNFQLGYRPSRKYGGPQGISLGTAVGISGAAASPNMGYHSSPALSFLLTLFNVRLGWWLGNPGRAGNRTFGLRNPAASLTPLIAEVFGLTTDEHPYVYLSDGGHFDNLGLYEMVLRRCHEIVVIDAGADASFGFEDLGNAVRKIRIDFGIPVEIDKIHIYPRDHAHPEQRYCAVGTIRYDLVDPGGKTGKLLYIKPAFYEREPRDVYNYAKTSLTFPHESTADQFFSESQFESYRALGDFALSEITSKSQAPINTISDLIKTAEEDYLPT